VSHCCRLCKRRRRENPPAELSASVFLIWARVESGYVQDQQTNAATHALCAIVRSASIIKGDVLSIPAGWYPQPDGHTPAGWYPRLPAGWYPRLPAGWHPRLPVSWDPRLPAGWHPQPDDQRRSLGGELWTEPFAPCAAEATIALPISQKEHVAASSARRFGVADSLGWGGLALVVLIGALSFGFSGATMTFGLFALVVGAIALARGRVGWARWETVWPAVSCSLRAWSL